MDLALLRERHDLRLTHAEDCRKQHAMTWADSATGERRGRVLCAMSGGVDSSLAAALLHEAGHDVVGVTLHLWDAQGEDRAGRCCAPEDREDARLTCDLLGVPHYVMDERAAFRSHVVEPFLDENLAGRTPIPCVHCNQHVKLMRLFELAHSFGASHVATGHYARVKPDAAGVRLLRGVDSNKDQSYFLFGVPQRVLSCMLFPLGHMTKPQARQEARRLGLPNWNKPDSQELCFIPDRDVSGFVARQRAEPGQAQKPGPLLDEQGRVLGQHRGIEGFTIGQRRGIGVSAPEARYVLRIVPDQRAVVVGPEAGLLRKQLRAERAAWVAGSPKGAFQGEVQIRHRHAAAAAWVTPSGAGFEVDFAEPQRAIAPGQAAVVYQGNAVIGGGFVA